MKSRKLVLSIILLIAFTLSLAACGQDQGTGTDKGSESKGTIAVLNYVSSAPYFACGEEKAIQAGKDAGYDVIYTGTPEVDTPKFISLIQDMIQKDVKALCVASGDSTSVVPVLKEAREKGIKVVSWDLDVAEEGRDLYAGTKTLVGCTDSKHIGTSCTEIMPPCHGKGQMLLHGFTHDDSIGIIVFECQWVFT
jgi:ABC-type sugar transport system substrate-binding protein